MKFLSRARFSPWRWSAFFLTAGLTFCVLAPLNGCSSTNAQANATAFSRDTALTARVKAELLRAPAIQGAEVKVDSQDGVVTLSGDVARAEQSAAAAAVARNVDGVSAVINAIRIATP